MKIRLMVALAILTAPLIGLAQPQLDEDLKGKIDVLCFNPIFGLRDNYNKKKRPVSWTFEQAQNHTRIIMGKTYANLVDPLTPVVLRVVNNTIRSLKETKDVRMMTTKLLTLSNLCVVDVRAQAELLPPAK